MTDGRVYTRGWHPDEIGWEKFDASKVQPWMLTANKDATDEPVLKEIADGRRVGQPLSSTTAAAKSNTTAAPASRAAFAHVMRQA